MNSEEAVRAERWLADHGVLRTGDGQWSEAGAAGGRLTANEVAHEWTEAALTDPDLDAGARLGLGFGLLDLLGAYGVTAEIGYLLEAEHDPLPADAFWAGYRRRLEAPEEPDAVTYSLWVDWFEDAATAERAFAEVLGNDLASLPDRRLPADEAAGDPLVRRARRVLACSGPVPWRVKRPAYETAAKVPALHPAVFRGLLASYHDVYGDLEPAAALALLRRLELPAGIEHLAALRTVLTAGHRNHRLAPEAWPGATARR